MTHEENAREIVEQHLGYICVNQLDKDCPHCEAIKVISSAIASAEKKGREEALKETDLSLVPVDVLIDELDKRFCHFIFSGCQVLAGKEGSREESKIFTMRKWNGNSATCIGLCGMLQVVITDAHLQKNELEEGDEQP